MDFDLQTPNSTVGEARIKAAYNAAVEVALEAAAKEFPEGGADLRLHVVGSRPSAGPHVDRA
ncbi:hypothetical protein JHN63_07560 [Streptomyces sp. MBT65]|uniref:hypothetical protein n=1 Tax=Streptomyces sp. MBT65 TaxID=1488395 RepID=UPI00190A0C31|nr:hypothetical protein [Streptomyces sp. MBT65]MBK3573674.1 hypothetical protein [Streptomyces sp. MBT65]